MSYSSVCCVNAWYGARCAAGRHILAKRNMNVLDWTRAHASARATMRDFTIGAVFGAVCMWLAYDLRGGATEFRVARRPVVAATTPCIIASSPSWSPHRRLQQADASANADSAAAMSTKHDLGGITIIGEHLLTTVHVAQVTPEGAIVVPPGTRRILFEIGCSDFFTMDEAELAKYNDSFLISFEPLLDKCARAPVIYIGFSYATTLLTSVCAHARAGTRGCSSAATSVTTVIKSTARRRSATTTHAVSCCPSPSPHVPSRNWPPSTFRASPAALLYFDSTKTPRGAESASHI